MWILFICNICYDIYSNEEFDHDAGESYEESAEGNYIKCVSLFIFLSVLNVTLSRNAWLEIDHHVFIFISR